MAFDKLVFAPLGDLAGVRAVGAPALWTYTTTDSAATVDSAGYFNDVSDRVAVGDIILARVATGGTATVLTYQVNANASGVVDVADGITVGGSTDTD